MKQRKAKKPVDTNKKEHKKPVKTLKKENRRQPMRKKRKWKEKKRDKTVIKTSE